MSELLDDFRAISFGRKSRKAGALAQHGLSRGQDKKIESARSGGRDLIDVLRKSIKAGVNRSRVQEGDCQDSLQDAEAALSRTTPAQVSGDEFAQQ